MTQAEIAAAMGLRDNIQVCKVANRAIRSLWRNHRRLTRILAGELPRPRDDQRGRFRFNH